MKFKNFYFHKTAFYHAVEKGNLEIIKLFLPYDKLNTNILNRILNKLLKHYFKNSNV